MDMEKNLYQQLADLLFPDITKTIADYETIYPPRVSWTQVSRIAPSPTGFLHIWSVYSAFVASRFVHQWDKNGTFFLRIEDTDQKREVPGAVAWLVKGFQNFGIKIDEWPIGGVDNPQDDDTFVWSDMGMYGPYLQSRRKDIYRTFVKQLVAEGKAYPCWMSQQEIDDTRSMQEAAKKIPGIYSQYALWRDADFEKQKEKIASWEPFVIRLRAPASPTDTVVVEDLIKWKVSMQANFLDIVLLKSTDNLPTYHMAHLVDDYLMRTTHVIRGDEWFPSLPLHTQLFEIFGFQPPQYAHIAPLQKLDDATNNRRKLSKRHDPEANVAWFFEKGIPTEAVLEFLMNLIDPFFEDWQKENPDKTYMDYSFDISRMNTSGALFDMTKLLFVSKEWLAKVSKDDFYDMVLQRAKSYWWTIEDILIAKQKEFLGIKPEEEIVDPDFDQTIGKKQLYELIKEQKPYTFNALNIERFTPTDPKRFHMLSDVLTQLPAFYDQVWQEMKAFSPALPDVCTREVMNPFIQEYLEELDLEQSKEDWFNQLKEIGKKYGFAPSNADFKQGWFIGKTGDLAMYLRIKLLCSKTTPDLYESMRVLGVERIRERLTKN